MKRTFFYYVFMALAVMTLQARVTRMISMRIILPMRSNMMVAAKF